ncbi:MAG: pilus assembly protein [Candidatus Firestonebacteria bacterium]|nr:pilus assembly protein [Candidatus Firestonebacteria bacterium]
MRGKTHGQALVEFVLVIPMFILVFICIIQTALLFNAQYTAKYASFCGARAAIVHAKFPDKPDVYAKLAARYVLNAGSLNPLKQVALVKGEYLLFEYRVTVTIPIKNYIPLYNLFVPIFPVKASTRLPVE